MPPRTDLLTTDSYARDYLDKAILSEKGITIKYEDKSQAFYARHAMYRARKADREMNRRLYAGDKDNPRYGKSDYDLLVVKLKENADSTCTLYLHKQEYDPNVPLEIQEIV